MRASRWLVLLASITAACGSSAPSADAGVDTLAPADTGPGDDGGRDAGPAPTDANVDAFVPGAITRSLTVGPFHVAPGVEQTLCVAVDLGNDAPMMLRAIRTHLTDGSHHLVVSHVDGPAAPDPVACPPLAHGIGQSIFIAESHESSLVYPANAGLPVTAHQSIGLELHMIDVTSDALDISGTVDLDLVPVDPAIREVRILFTGDMALNLPPHMDTTVSDVFPMQPGSEVFAMTTHTHQLGIDATLDLTSDASAAGTRVHESLNWSDPPLTIYDPPLVMGASDMVRLTCTFRNTGDTTVRFGTSFNDEMCFFWAYYLDPL